MTAKPQALPVSRSQRPELTTAERLRAIEQMCQRVNGYAQFMSGALDLPGSSAEAKEKAVAAFYEQMVAFELQLARIHEGLKLG
jgi:hypothetical protein